MSNGKTKGWVHIIMDALKDVWYRLVEVARHINECHAVLLPPTRVAKHVRTWPEVRHQQAKSQVMNRKPRHAILLIRNC